MPVFTRGTIIPIAPTDLAAVGYSNGINALDWVSGNIPGTVTFAIECKIGDTSPYVLVGTTTQQKWIHEGVTPGQFYQYRTRAQAARGSFRVVERGRECGTVLLRRRFLRFTSSV